MRPHNRLSLAVIGTLAALALGVLVYAWSGLYYIGADQPHTPPMHAFLQLMRERSIAVRADDLAPPPDLADPARIRRGAGNYAAMCAVCHLAPGMDETELSRGLYPSPPNLGKATPGPAEAFWVIEHGLKASGMPAWGESMEDRYLWDMVAFLQVLPTLDAAEYDALVASSGGHSHGGGETDAHVPGAATAPGDHGGAAEGGADHPHPPGTPADHHDSEDGDGESGGTIVHRHADGTVEAHPAESEAEIAAPDRADDGREHRHQH